jgi:hypothetical protein
MPPTAAGGKGECSMPAPVDPVSKFINEYDLWSLVLLLCLLGLRDIASLVVWSWYRLLDEIDEASYAHKIHSAEHRRRYEHIAGEKSLPE